MNILPHKSWHVRTKKNIARVRKDEAKAAEEEQKRKERIQLAEREARTELLRQKARGNVTLCKDFISFSSEISDQTPAETSNLPSEHVNFFKDLEDGTAELKEINKEHEKEKKEEQEKYEKKIGYLTYLGQDTNEALGKKSWYEEAPQRSTDMESAEVNMKVKQRLDPLNIIKKCTMKTEKTDKINCAKITGQPVIEFSKEAYSCVSSTFKCFPSVTSDKFDKIKPHKKHKRHKHKNKRMKSKKTSSDSDSDSEKKKHKHKSKKRKRSKSESSESNNSEEERIKQEKFKKLEALRMERLKREQEERKKAEALIAKIYGAEEKKEKEPTHAVNRKYNSQFNPEIAKQNYLHLPTRR